MKGKIVTLKLKPRKSRKNGVLSTAGASKAPRNQQTVIIICNDDDNRKDGILLTVDFYIND